MDNGVRGVGELGVTVLLELLVPLLLLLVDDDADDEDGEAGDDDDDVREDEDWPKREKEANRRVADGGVDDDMTCSIVVDVDK